MIYFISTRQTYNQLLALSDWPVTTLWVSSNILNPTELAELRNFGISVTVFTKPTPLESALNVIREHHPDQLIWIDGYIKI